ncbi:hypothetical protein EKTHUN627_18890 [Enterobacter kobei]|nr:hypothetical protein EKTHUN627_18890 [Enterobacter kobei]
MLLVVAIGFAIYLAIILYVIDKYYKKIITNRRVRKTCKNRNLDHNLTTALRRSE